MKRYHILCLYTESEHLEQLIKAAKKIIGPNNVFVDTDLKYPEISVVCSKQDWERIKALMDCWKQFII